MVGFPFTLLWSFAIGIWLITSCVPARAIQIRHVDYNLRDEGYLDKNTLQTIGRIQANRKTCKLAAKKQAEKKMLSIFLHTKLNLAATANNIGHKSFVNDYPYHWTSDQYQLARQEFDFLLKQAKIFLEDLRKNSECSVTIRLKTENIPKQIRQRKLMYIDTKTFAQKKRSL